MFPEVGATELMVIAAVALIVVGPKDLPVLLRKLGQFMARMRGMANEFRASFDEMARQSELDELRREVQALRTGQYMDPVNAAASSHSAEINDVFYEIEQDISAMPAGTSPMQMPLMPEAVAETPELAEPAKSKTSRAPRVKAAPPSAPKAAAKAKSGASSAPKAAAKPKAKPKPKPKPKPEAES